MKIVNIIISGVCLLSLTACGNFQNWNSDYLTGGEYLSNDHGMVINCYGNHISTKHNSESEANKFWQANNLPKGTANFVCKDSKAYLPNKVTDCRGNLISKQSGGVEDFRAKYNLNSGNMRFTCNNGKVTPVLLSSLQ
ncbi:MULTISPECIES: hypothetical protein [unclassified Psychrobacter]|uniref:hypothetical protein n=1 Tax=unclassified Psychrobacter TaxID=196806 RepID=UPI0025B3B9B8|nr:MULTISPECIES: hypothetical protein [unclassified Psychrobacter]MDN3454141.1 hypothetical protein [Psychrobacter sp. APC 3350]MDN3502857.1 hypothetical protein [Psychrobacter sp. 5A.1]